MKDKKKLTVACPKCKKKFSYFESKFRPFCTEKCKMVDLGHWIEGDYSVPVVEFDDLPMPDEEMNESDFFLQDDDTEQGD